MSELLSASDRQQLEAEGISVSEAEWQLKVLSGAPPTRMLLRACSIDDGVARLGAEAVDAAIAAYERGRQAGKLAKFVPASGAASRMFECLRSYEKQAASGDSSAFDRLVASGDAQALACKQVFDQLDGLALCEDVAAELARHGEQLEEVQRTARWSSVVAAALEADRLNLPATPKGLVKFHRSPTGSRTAFEEHLVEAALLLADTDGKCRMEFTVLPEHQERFSETLESVRPRIESEHGVSLEVRFSYQESSTMTVALASDGTPFHLSDGTLLLRPGGHGSLIKNLARARHDVLFVSNIDNIVPDRLKDIVVHWKKVLMGHLLVLQERAFDALRKLRDGSVDDGELARVVDLVRGPLNGSLVEGFDRESSEDQRKLLIEALDRPIRVCGVVKNEGEPGGGPFWVVDAEGRARPQIVEGTEVDQSDSEQQAIFASASHFNPVSVACGLKNVDGEAFDLDRFVDDSAVFIAKKSHDGRELFALERPGLWNGAMSRWTTIFVEVPVETFNPVKTINDLLRESHR